MHYPRQFLLFVRTKLMKLLVGVFAVCGLVAGSFGWMANQHIPQSLAADTANLRMQWLDGTAITPVSGAAVTTRLAVFNDGPSDATGVVVKLDFVQLPSDSGHFSLTDTQSSLCNSVFTVCDSSGNFSAETGEWTIGTLPSGTAFLLVVNFTMTTTNDNDQSLRIDAELIASNQDDPSCDGSDIVSPINCYDDGIDQGNDLLSFTVTPYIRSDLRIYWAHVSNTSPVSGEVINVKLRARNEGPSPATNVKVDLNFFQQQLVESDWVADSGHFTLNTDSIVSHVCEYYSGICGDSYGSFDPDTGIWDIGNLEVFMGSTNWRDAELSFQFIKTTTTLNDRRVIMQAEITDGDQDDPSCPPSASHPNNCFGDGVNQNEDFISTTVRPYIRSDVRIYWNTVSDPSPVNGTVTTVRLRARNDGPIPATGIKVNLRLIQQQLIEGEWQSDTGNFTLDTDSIVSRICEFYTGTCGAAYGTYDVESGEWDIGNLELFTGSTNWREAELYFQFTKTTTNSNDRRVVLQAEIMSGDQADPSCNGDPYSITNCFGDGINQNEDLISATVRPYIRSDIRIYWNTVSDPSPINGAVTTVRLRARNEGPVPATGIKVNLNLIQQVLIDSDWSLADDSHFTLDTDSIASRICEFYTGTCGSAYGTFDVNSGEWDIGNLELFTGSTNWREAELYFQFTKTTTNANDRRVVLQAEVMSGDQADPSCNGDPYSITNCFGDGVNQGEDFISATVRSYIRSDIRIYWNMVSDPSPVNGTVTTVRLRARNEGPIPATGVKVNLNLIQQQLVEGEWQGDTGNFTLDTDSIVSRICELYTGTCGSAYGTFDVNSGEWNIGNLELFTGSTNWHEAELYFQFTKTTTNANDRRVLLQAEVTSGDQADPSCNGDPYSVTNCFGDGVNQGEDLISATVHPYIRSNLRMSLNHSGSVAGQAMTYTLTLVNDGPSTATNVAVSYPLPSNVAFVSYEPTYEDIVTSDVLDINYNAASGIWYIDSLRSTGIIVLTIHAVPLGTDLVSATAEIMSADQADPTCDGSIYSITNCFGDGVNQGEDLVVNNFTPTLDPASADLSVAASSDVAETSPGEEVHFTFSVTNNGPALATHVNVSINFSDGLNYLSDDAEGDYDNESHIWSIASLAVDETRTFHIVGTVVGAGAYVITENVIASDQIDPDSVVNNSRLTEDDMVSFSINGQAVDIRLNSVVFPGTTMVGQSVDYFLSIINDGPDDAENIVVNITVPENVTYISTSEPLAYNPAAHQWSVASLLAGQAKVMTVTFAPTQPGEYDITAELVDVSPQDLNDTNNSIVTSFSATPGIGYLSGHIFTDSNSNGNQDGGEPNGFATADVLITNGSVSYHPYINGSGDFSQAVGPGNYTVVITGGLGTTVRPMNGSTVVTILGGDNVSAGSFGISGTYTGGGSGGSSGSSSGVFFGGGSSSSGNSSGWSSGSSSSSSRSRSASSRSTPRLSRNQETPGTASPTPAPVTQLPLSCLSIGAAPALIFSDMSTPDPDVDFLSSTVFLDSTNQRVVQGANGQFNGSHLLTRFELTKLVLAASCINYLSTPVANQHFTDVSQDQSEFSLVIGNAFSNHIVSGIGDRFYPQNNVTYGELFKILFNAARQQGYRLPAAPLTSPLQGITDESFRSTAEQAVSLGLLSLDSDQDFPQNKPVTRLEMAKIFAKYFRILKGINQ